MSTDDQDIGHAAAEGKITPEAIKAAENMIGMQLRPEGPYMQDATEDTMRNWCNGIGDLNPLYRDLEYGRLSRYGSIVAHPNFPMAFGWIGRTRWGLPGVHGFYAGNDWELFRHVRPGDRITAIERVVGIDVKESKFSGTLVMQYVEATFANQFGDVVAKALGTCTRHERKAAREAGKYDDIKTHEYSAEDFARIDQAILDEEKNMRGGNVRYWDEVQEGEELPEIVRGPLSLMDTMGFLVGSGRGHTHGVIFKNAVKHPGHFFRNPEAGGGIEYTGIGHHRESTAKEVGVPGVYDYGPQRSSWMASLVTNWMGDAGFLRQSKCQIRRHNPDGDVLFIDATVIRKFETEGRHLVEIAQRAETHRGEASALGSAIVELPTRG